jgi:hypothetical protein
MLEGGPLSFETIRLRLSARPYQPFRIVTSSGESYEVRHPEMAIVTKTEIVVALPDADGIPPRLQLVATLHVPALKPLNTAGAA